MDIGEPLALAKLARPKSENGRIYSSQVHSIIAGKKRKRQEICTGVDGDSINVYDINHGRILSSCSISLDSVLSCAPCSLRITTETGQKARSTYYTTQRRNETILSLFEENLTRGATRPAIKNRLLLPSANTIVQLEVVPSKNTHRILAIREDGQFEIYNADLSSRILHGHLRSQSEHSRLVTVQWLSQEDAAKSVLKARPDIRALANPGATYITGVFSVLDTLSTGMPKVIEIGVWSLPELSSGTSAELTLDAVLHHKFPIAAPLLSGDKEPVIFASKATRLVVRTQSKMHTFNLTLSTPRQIHELSPVATDQISSIYISDALVLSSTSSTIQLHNSQFNTLQTKFDLSKKNLKRKRGAGSDGPIQLLSFFPAINRVVASRRDYLVVIDLQISGGGNFTTAAKQSSSLLSNIGRGSAIAQERVKSSQQNSDNLTGQTGIQAQTLRKWQSFTKDLNRFLQENDSTKFEDVVLADIGDGIQQLPAELQNEIEARVDHVLSRVFEYKLPIEDGPHIRNDRLKLAVPGQKLLRYLAVNGYLTVERLNKALRGSTRSTFELVNHGNVAQILVDNDPSLHLLATFLQEASYIAHEELCELVLIVLQRVLKEASVVRLSSDPDPAMLESDGDAGDFTLISAPRDVTSANTAECLCVAISRLSHAAHGTFSRFMRNSFTQQEVIALVQFLRQQLFRSGYTRSLQTQLYPTPPTSQTGVSIDCDSLLDKPAPLSLSAIASVLSSCIDAIGPAGVLGFGDEEEFVQALIPELSSEITKATEAVQEAILLEGTVRETLRFVESVSQKVTTKTTANSSEHNPEPKQGRIITLYSEPTVGTGLDQHSAALPLESGGERHTNPLKVRKGDGKVSKRSAREVGMLQDRSRGPYALERLVF